MNKNIEEIKKKITPILKKHGIKKAAISGSFARNEVTKESDIDILVEIPGDISLLDFVGIKLELEKKLGREVDLIEYSTIKPEVKEEILKEEVSIL